MQKTKSKEKSDETFQKTAEAPLIAWYDAPAERNHEGWEQHATPLGNGFLGAMVHGGVAVNQIQLNDHALWSGGPGASSAYKCGMKGEADAIHRTLHEVQGEVQKMADYFAENLAPKQQPDGSWQTHDYAEYPGYGDIREKVESMFGEKDYFGSYQTLGDLYIRNPEDDDSYTGYSRSLSLNDGVLTIQYDQNGTHCTGEYFLSNPDNMMAIRLSADKKGALTKEISIDSPQPQKTIRADSKENALIMTGRPSDHQENGEKFALLVKVTASGDGAVVSARETAVQVTGADEILLYVAAGTNYKQPMDGSFDFFSEENPLDAARERIGEAMSLGFAGLLERHKADYRKLFCAAQLNLGITKVPEKTTDALMKGYRGGTPNPNTESEDRYLENLYYQFGRYLLIASSRKGSLPANLQGIWADSLSPAWDADYHTNINLQMNYWLAEQTNLSECHLPVTDYVKSLEPYGTKGAAHHYVREDGVSPVRGWTIGHECNIWGNAAPGTSSASYFPTAGAWMCQDIWEHYLFTRDEEFLGENYHILLNAALFWVDYLWTDRRDGRLTANPSYSPEHGPYTIAAACDQGIIWEIFHEVILAGEILGKTDAPEYREIQQAFGKLSSPLQIGKNGQFMEWKDETTMDVTGDQGHRHTNHLFVLHPGNQVVAGRSEEDDQYIQAMKTTLNTRGDSSTGWSMAWKLNFWTRLRDGERAHTLLKTLLKEKTADNLFDLHPPFQIDGNFGATAGMTEMFLQSQGDAIELLPALPKAWPEGCVTGLKARGDVEVDIWWSQGRLVNAVLRPKYDGTYKITGKQIAKARFEASDGTAVAVTPYKGYLSAAIGNTADDVILAQLKGDETYSIF